MDVPRILPDWTCLLTESILVFDRIGTIIDSNRWSNSAHNADPFFTSNDQTLISQLFPEELSSRILQMAETVFTTGEVSSFEISVEHETSTCAFAILMGRLTSDLVIVVFNNISEQSRLSCLLRQLHDETDFRVEERTRQLMHANEELRNAQSHMLHLGKMAWLGGLVAGIAHEMNTPLGTLLASTDTLVRALKRLENSENSGLDSLRSSQALKSLLAIQAPIAASAARISAIVHSLRSFARIDQADCQTVDIRKCIDDVLAILEHQIHAHGVTVHKLLPTELLVDCNPREMNQALANIIQNAIDAMPSGGTLSVEAEIQRQSINISVSDTGKGIPLRILDRVFDPGFTTKGVGVGLGLGLPIARKIIEDHHGTIAVAPPGKGGARIVVILPSKM